ncbi:hypothetical protein C922_04521 [Plasmodium inui San Antonio 1]|uniref:PI3K/PI4K catalytic domain-containing protein n=1 Tax=Plasmodium inui San Antonio 1 TaxID=1237626 RepID=W7AIJ2_9APIC|nr:hypothetical protein C922_04521 [Plasmodium inui San Antonio 1]EUD65121.1 hypothetical protein C922_04521 [Plasmodium inui San Antonio 1]
MGKNELEERNRALKDVNIENIFKYVVRCGLAGRKKTALIFYLCNSLEESHLERNNVLVLYLSLLSSFEGHLGELFQSRASAGKKEQRGNPEAQESDLQLGLKLSKLNLLFSYIITHISYFVSLSGKYKEDTSLQLFVQYMHIRTFVTLQKFAFQKKKKSQLQKLITLNHLKILLTFLINMYKYRIYEVLNEENLYMISKLIFSIIFFFCHIRENCKTEKLFICFYDYVYHVAEIFIRRYLYHLGKKGKGSNALLVYYQNMVIFVCDYMSKLKVLKHVERYILNNGKSPFCSVTLLSVVTNTVERHLLRPHGEEPPFMRLKRREVSQPSPHEGSSSPLTDEQNGKNGYILLMERRTVSQFVFLKLLRLVEILLVKKDRIYLTVYLHETIGRVTKSTMEKIFLIVNGGDERKNNNIMMMTYDRLFYLYEYYCNILFYIINRSDKRKVRDRRGEANRSTIRNTVYMYLLNSCIFHLYEIYPLVILLLHVTPNEVRSILGYNKFSLVKRMLRIHIGEMEVTRIVNLSIFFFDVVLKNVISTPLVGNYTFPILKCLLWNDKKLSKFFQTVVGTYAGKTDGCAVIEWQQNSVPRSKCLQEADRTEQNENPNLGYYHSDVSAAHGGCGLRRAPLISANLVVNEKNSFVILVNSYVKLNWANLGGEAPIGGLSSGSTIDVADGAKVRNELSRLNHTNRSSTNGCLRKRDHSRCNRGATRGRDEIYTKAYFPLLMKHLLSQLIKRTKKKNFLDDMESNCNNYLGIYINKLHYYCNNIFTYKPIFKHNFSSFVRSHMAKNKRHLIENVSFFNQMFNLYSSKKKGSEKRKKKNFFFKNKTFVLSSIEKKHSYSNYTFLRKILNYKISYFDNEHYYFRFLFNLKFLHNLNDYINEYFLLKKKQLNRKVIFNISLNIKEKIKKMKPGLNDLYDHPVGNASVGSLGPFGQSDLKLQSKSESIVKDFQASKGCRYWQPKRREKREGNLLLHFLFINYNYCVCKQDAGDHMSRYLLLILKYFESVMPYVHIYKYICALLLFLISFVERKPLSRTDVLRVGGGGSALGRGAANSLTNRRKLGRKVRNNNPKQYGRAASKEGHDAGEASPVRGNAVGRIVLQGVEKEYARVEEDVMKEMKKVGAGRHNLPTSKCPLLQRASNRKAALKVLTGTIDRLKTYLFSNTFHYLYQDVRKYNKYITMLSLYFYKLYFTLLYFEIYQRDYLQGSEVDLIKSKIAEITPVLSIKYLNKNNIHSVCKIEIIKSIKEDRTENNSQVEVNNNDVDKLYVLIMHYIESMKRKEFILYTLYLLIDKAIFRNKYIHKNVKKLIHFKVSTFLHDMGEFHDYSVIFSTLFLQMNIMSYNKIIRNYIYFIFDQIFKLKFSILFDGGFLICFLKNLEKSSLDYAFSKMIYEEKKKFKNFIDKKKSTIIKIIYKVNLYITINYLLFLKMLNCCKFFLNLYSFFYYEFYIFCVNKYVRRYRGRHKERVEERLEKEEKDDEDDDYDGRCYYEEVSQGRRAKELCSSFPDRGEQGAEGVGGLSSGSVIAEARELLEEGDHPHGSPLHGSLPHSRSAPSSTGRRSSPKRGRSGRATLKGLHSTSGLLSMGNSRGRSNYRIIGRRRRKINSNFFETNKEFKEFLENTSDESQQSRKPEQPPQPEQSHQPEQSNPSHQRMRPRLVMRNDTLNNDANYFKVLKKIRGGNTFICNLYDIKISKRILYNRKHIKEYMNTVNFVISVFLATNINNLNMDTLNNNYIYIISKIVKKNIKFYFFYFYYSIFRKKGKRLKSIYSVNLDTIVNNSFGGSGTMGGSGIMETSHNVGRSGNVCKLSIKKKYIYVLYTLSTILCVYNYKYAFFNYYFFVFYKFVKMLAKMTAKSIWVGNYLVDRCGGEAAVPADDSHCAEKNAAERTGLDEPQKPRGHCKLSRLSKRERSFLESDMLMIKRYVNDYIRESSIRMHRNLFRSDMPHKYVLDRYTTLINNTLLLLLFTNYLSLTYQNINLTENKIVQRKITLLEKYKHYLMNKIVQIYFLNIPYLCNYLVVTLEFCLLFSRTFLTINYTSFSLMREMKAIFRNGYMYRLVNCLNALQHMKTFYHLSCYRSGNLYFHNYKKVADEKFHCFGEGNLGGVRDVGVVAGVISCSRVARGNTTLERAEQDDSDGSLSQYDDYIYKDAFKEVKEVLKKKTKQHMRDYFERSMKNIFYLLDCFKDISSISLFLNFYLQENTKIRDIYDNLHIQSMNNIYLYNFKALKINYHFLCIVFLSIVQIFNYTSNFFHSYSYVIDLYAKYKYSYFLYDYSLRNFFSFFNVYMFQMSRCRQRKKAFVNFRNQVNTICISDIFDFNRLLLQKGFLFLCFFFHNFENVLPDIYCVNCANKYSVGCYHRNALPVNLGLVRHGKKGKPAVRRISKQDTMRAVISDPASGVANGERPPGKRNPRMAANHVSDSDGEDSLPYVEVEPGGENDPAVKDSNRVGKKTQEGYFEMFYKREGDKKMAVSVEHAGGIRSPLQIDAHMDRDIKTHEEEINFGVKPTVGHFQEIGAQKGDHSSGENLTQKGEKLKSEDSQLTREVSTPIRPKEPSRRSKEGAKTENEEHSSTIGKYAGGIISYFKNKVTRMGNKKGRGTGAGGRRQVRSKTGNGYSFDDDFVDAEEHARCSSCGGSSDWGGRSLMRASGIPKRGVNVRGQDDAIYDRNEKNGKEDGSYDEGEDLDNRDRGQHHHHRDDDDLCSRKVREKDVELLNAYKYLLTYQKRNKRRLYDYHLKEELRCMCINKYIHVCNLIYNCLMYMYQLKYKYKDMKKKGFCLFAYTPFRRKKELDNIHSSNVKNEIVINTRHLLNLDFIIMSTLYLAESIYINLYKCKLFTDMCIFNNIKYVCLENSQVKKKNSYQSGDHILHSGSNRNNVKAVSERKHRRDADRSAYQSSYVTYQANANGSSSLSRRNVLEEEGEDFGSCKLTRGNYNGEKMKPGANSRRTTPVDVGMAAGSGKKKQVEIDTNHMCSSGSGKGNVSDHRSSNSSSDGGGSKKNSRAKREKNKATSRRKKKKSVSRMSFFLRRRKKHDVPKSSRNLSIRNYLFADKNLSKKSCKVKDPSINYFHNYKILSDNYKAKLARMNKKKRKKEKLKEKEKGKKEKKKEKGKGKKKEEKEKKQKKGKKKGPPSEAIRSTSGSAFYHNYGIYGIDDDHEDDDDDEDEEGKPSRKAKWNFQSFFFGRKRGEVDPGRGSAHHERGKITDAYRTSEPVRIDNLFVKHKSRSIKNSDMNRLLKMDRGALEEENMDRIRHLFITFNNNFKEKKISTYISNIFSYTSLHSNFNVFYRSHFEIFDQKIKVGRGLLKVLYSYYYRHNLSTFYKVFKKIEYIYVYLNLHFYNSLFNMDVKELNEDINKYSLFMMVKYIKRHLHSNPKLYSTFIVKVLNFANNGVHKMTNFLCMYLYNDLLNVLHQYLIQVSISNKLTLNKYNLFLLRKNKLPYVPISNVLFLHCNQFSLNDIVKILYSHPQYGLFLRTVAVSNLLYWYKKSTITNCIYLQLFEYLKVDLGNRVFFFIVFFCFQSFLFLYQLFMNLHTYIDDEYLVDLVLPHERKQQYAVEELSDGGRKEKTQIVSALDGHHLDHQCVLFNTEMFARKTNPVRNILMILFPQKSRKNLPTGGESDKHGDTTNGRENEKDIINMDNFIFFKYQRYVKKSHVLSIKCFLIKKLLIQNLRDKSRKALIESCRFHNYIFYTSQRAAQLDKNIQQDFVKMEVQNLLNTMDVHRVKLLTSSNVVWGVSDEVKILMSATRTPILLTFHTSAMSRTTVGSLPGHHAKKTMPTDHVSKKRTHHRMWSLPNVRMATSNGGGDGAPLKKNDRSLFVSEGDVPLGTHTLQEQTRSGSEKRPHSYYLYSEGYNKSVRTYEHASTDCIKRSGKLPEGDIEGNRNCAFPSLHSALLTPPKMSQNWEDVSYIYKVNDDVRQDKLVIQIIHIFIHILSDYKSSYNLFPYNIVTNKYSNVHVKGGEGDRNSKCAASRGDGVDEAKTRSGRKFSFSFRLFRKRKEQTEEEAKGEVSKKDRVGRNASKREPSMEDGNTEDLSKNSTDPRGSCNGGDGKTPLMREELRSANLERSIIPYIPEHISGKSKGVETSRKKRKKKKKKKLENFGAVIEVLANTKSRHEIGRKYKNIIKFYHLKFSHINTYIYALKNFICSLAAYSLLSFVLQVKDRHNGNLLFDDYGNIIHIDFGYILNIYPGISINFELAPFKLTREMIMLLTMKNQKKQYFIFTYIQLVVKGYLLLREKSDWLISSILSLSHSDINCFKYNTVEKLRKRLKLDKSDNDASIFMINKIHQAYNNITTIMYDYIQNIQQGIQ